MVGIRRELHAHPELAFNEYRTTELIVERLRASGLEPRVLPDGTGVICDIGGGARTVALRADIDALPINDQKDVPYRSTVDGVCHGCGHDAHTAILLGAAHELARRPLAGRVRLIFQPAEEAVPGGAPGRWRPAHSTASRRSSRCTATRGCRPARSASGRADHRRLRSRRGALRRPGGHTARPHLTQDVVFALGELITDLPGLLSRRVDPRAALSLVWGAVEAGRATNAIPMSGAAARRRCGCRPRRVGPRPSRSSRARRPGGGAVRGAGRDTYTPRRAAGRQRRRRGRRAARGDRRSTRRRGARRHRAEHGRRGLRLVPRRRAGRAGPSRRPPARGAAFDLHQGTFDIDEAALDVGVRYTVALAQAALAAR